MDEWTNGQRRHRRPLEKAYRSKGMGKTAVFKLWSSIWYSISPSMGCMVIWWFCCYWILYTSLDCSSAICSYSTGSSARLAGTKNSYQIIWHNLSLTLEGRERIWCRSQNTNCTRQMLYRQLQVKKMCYFTNKYLSIWAFMKALAISFNWGYGSLMCTNDWLSGRTKCKMTLVNAGATQA